MTMKGKETEGLSRARAKAVRREAAIVEAERLAGLRRARGVGLGDGEDYVSSIHVREFASLGRSSRKPVFGKRRLHTTFSDIETDLLLNLSWDDDVLQIREQFALDLRTTMEIADWLGVNHPRHDGKLKIMTVDLLVSRASTPVDEAISVKPARKLRNRRVQDKLEIERRYSMLAGWKHTIRSEEVPARAETRNLRHLVGFWEYDPPPGMAREDVGRLAGAVLRLAGTLPGMPLATVCGMADREVGARPGTSLSVVWHMLATKTWMTPLDLLLNPSGPVPLSVVAQGGPSHA